MTANKKHKEHKENAVQRQEEQQSLDRMLATIGPYLPKRLFGQAPEPSDWKLTNGDSVSARHASATPPDRKSGAV